MKVLIVSPVSYYPANSGNSARIEQLINAIKAIDKNIELTFVLCPVQKIMARYSGSLPENNGVNHIVLNNGSGFSASFLYRFMKSFRRVIKKILNIKIDILDDFMFKDALIGKQAKSEFHRVVKDIKPDVIIVEYLVMSALVLSLAEKPILVVDTHDKLTNRNQILRAENSNAFWLSLTQNQEKSLLERFDCAIAIQYIEASYFKKLVNNKTDIRTISILEPPKVIGLTQNNTKTIGFIGSNNQHNIDGLSHFILKVWPGILIEVPGATLLIAGSIDQKLPIFDHENVQHIGRVNELADFYQACSLIINPCISGTGLKIKTVEALCYGKIVVATEKGGEGLEDAVTHGLFIEKFETNGFYKKCVDILSNVALKDELESKSILYIEKKYKQSLEELKMILKI